MNATITAKPFLDQSSVKALLTERVNNSIIYFLLSLHIQTPVNSCSRSGTFTSGLEYLRLLVNNFKQLFSY